MYRNGKGLGVGCFLSSIWTVSNLIGCKVEDVKGIKAGVSSLNSSGYFQSIEM